MVFESFWVVWRFTDDLWRVSLVGMVVQVADLRKLVLKEFCLYTMLKGEFYPNL